MADETEDISGTGMEQIKIIMNTLYLCIGYAVKHIKQHEGEDTAIEFKAKLLESLGSGDINMALLEETKTFDLVVSKIEALDVAEM